MISLEEVRSTVVAAFKSAHEVSYSGVLVNYPNYVVVDLEHQRAPFVSIEMELTDTSQAAIGEREITAQGVLRVYYYYRDGTGMSGAFSYIDAMNDNLGMMWLGGVYYQSAKVLDVVSFPGWKGKLLEFKFAVVDGVEC